MQASSLLNLGVVALRQEHFDEALEWSNLAAGQAKSVGDQLIQEKSQGNVAYADYALGNFEEALDRFREAHLDAKKLGSQDDEIEWLNDQGLSLYQLGDHVQAESCYKGALQIAETIKRQSKVIEAHTALASLYLQLGRLDEATQHDDIALALAHTYNRTLDEADALFVRSDILIRQSNFNAAKDILSVLEQQPSLEPSQRWRVEGALANLYAQTSQPVLADKWYQQSITTFETQRASIKKEESKLPFSSNADRLYDDYVRFLVSHQKTDEALQWLDLARAQTLQEGLGMASPDFKAVIKKPLDTTAIARRLHATILVYTLAPQESYLWAVNSSGVHFFRLPPQEEIDAHVKNYQRTILASRDPLQNGYVDGMALYRLLVEPAASLIPKGSPVYIIPDGSLTTLNFETLLVPGSGIHYWIEDATITNASSLKLLAAFHPERHARNPKKLLLIGNPVSPDTKFPDLPKASDEVTNVARHFPPAEETVFVQKQALPSAYADSAPGEYSLIHFVAHGTSSSASPLDSAIVLTRNPANPDSFKLYARDVMEHPLHADLVVISACYGSGSRVYGGEGLVGLSWAFLRAGSHYVIGSLWAVSDSAAPDIMDRMYDDLASGRPPDAALRNAKLSMINTPNIFRKPLYWATFQLYGGA
jgi:CHAT domain-containing protein/Tfp pilus assembly protein PilF